MASPLKVAQLNYSDNNGGAARAAYRIHHALRNVGIDSQMLVSVAASGDWTVQGPISPWAKGIGRIRPQLVIPLRKLLRTGNPIIHSPALVPSRWPERLNASGAVVVHLHWVQGEMLSIADIGRIRKPVVWTLHDMWAFCGAEHYSTDHRWRDGYRSDNRPAHEGGFDLNRNTWHRKHKHWRQPMQIVCPSQWLADSVRASALMGAWPVAVVPNPIDTDRWQPMDQRLARQLLGLPQDCPLLLWGAMGGGNDPRKGIDLLLAALTQLRSELTLHDLQLVVFGQHSPQSPPQLGFPVHYTGHFYDDLSLRALYSAADAMVIPSRQDNFPNTGLEAHACGTPVVAFNIGGMPDIVADRVTGALAEPFEPESLSGAIRWILDDRLRPQQLGAAARLRAEQLWAPVRIANLYRELYENIRENSLQASSTTSSLR
jgi:glycosyltransferase involved in cell wall biosynthesis